jgi:hypothetical protein
MQLVPMTIEEVILLGITRFYVLEKEDHLISAKMGDKSPLLWDTINQKWDKWYSNTENSSKALVEYINDNKFPVFIKSNKETNDTRSK